MKRWCGIIKSETFTANTELEIIPPAWQKLGEWYGIGTIKDGTASPGCYQTNLGEIVIRKVYTEKGRICFDFIGDSEFIEP